MRLNKARDMLLSAHSQTLLTHSQELNDLWDWCGRLDSKVSRLHDLADPLELEAVQRKAYKKLSDLQGQVEALGMELADLMRDNNIQAMKTLLDNIWNEIGLMKQQQEQTWALVQRAVIRP